MEANLEKKDVNRKDFLSLAILAIGGVISFAIGIPAVAYILGPALKKADEQNWIPLGAASKVELGVPTLFKAKIEQKAGWITNEQELTFYVLTDNGRDFVAMSNVCTHLGCRVRWVEDQDQFFCPCTTPCLTNRERLPQALRQDLSTDLTSRSKMTSYLY